MSMAIIIAFYLFMVIFMITGDAGITISCFIAFAIVAFPIGVVVAFVLEYQESTWKRYRKDPWTGKEKRYELVKPTIRGYLFAILKGVLALLFLPFIGFLIFSVNEEPMFSTFSSWIGDLWLSWIIPFKYRFKWWIGDLWNDFSSWILAVQWESWVASVIAIITLITLVKRISTKLDKELTHID